MRRLAAPFLLLAFAAPTAVAQTPTPAPAPAEEPRIRAGVSAQGIDVGGLTVAEATTKLQGALHGFVGRGTIVHVGARSFRLEAKDIDLTFDAERTAKRALYAKAGVTDVPLATTHSLGKVRAFVEDLNERVSVAPRNATSKIAVRKITIKRARVGKRIDTDKARVAISTVLDDTTLSRNVRVKVVRVSPKINANDERKRLSTVLTVDKSAFKLRLFKNLKVVKTYGVATGLPAYPTPTGLFSIQNKQVNPTWSVPNSPWAGELAGTTVQGGTAQNPLKARWMGIVNGVGFHGTGEEGSIGSRASHGCLRMRVADIIALYPRVPVGTPVLLAN